MAQSSLKTFQELEEIYPTYSACERERYVSVGHTTDPQEAMAASDSDIQTEARPPA